MSCPPSFDPVLSLARRCRDAGGRALVVGGAVRDMLLERYGLSPDVGPDGGGLPIDLDVEVHGLSARRLEAILGRLGPVNLVGKSFMVFKLTIDGADLDVSLPRRDSRVRAGHRGIQVHGDPHLGLVEAARRRDLTVNAIALDPLTGELVDPFDGQRDLRRRLLRAVDPTTFTEDPLRALRVPQFAARFRFDVDPALRELCASVPVHELPAERIHAELRKLLLLPREPSWGVRVGVEARLWRRVHPALERDDWDAVCLAVDRAAVLRDGGLFTRGARAEALMLSAFVGGVLPSALSDLLDRLDVFTLSRFPLRSAVLAALGRSPDLRAPLDDGALRLLAREAQDVGGVRLWLAVAQAHGSDCAEPAARAEQLEVGLRAPERLVLGRHLKALGIPAGPEMGVLLEGLYLRQLTEGIQDRDHLLEGLPC